MDKPLTLCKLMGTMSTFNVFQCTFF
uniref:Uncharacterized protein n=1 Tax=Tetranychus urticae TaxID=32264 RepID=T1KVG2_TETUR